MKIIVFGKPNSGKGSRLNEIRKKIKEPIHVLAVGDLLRQEVEEGTELGKLAKQYMSQGLLVPDEVINNMMLNKIRETQGIIVLDGYPRTVQQANAMLEGDEIPDIVMELYVDDAIALNRASDRIVCKKCGRTYTIANEEYQPKQAGICDDCGTQLVRRKDDEPETAKKRLAVYADDTYPVLNLMQERGIKVITIDNSTEHASKDFEKEFLGAINQK